MAIDDNTTYGLLGSQVKDLANNVNAKATITMTSTDPGEGSPLAANHYVAVYGTMGSLLDIFYPVGSYYETSDATFDPNVSWGGTWVEDSAGKTLVAQDTNDTDFATVGNTGGRKWSGFTDNNWKIDNNSGAAQQVFINYSNKYTVTSGDQTNMPPYIIIKRWHRTA